MVGFVFPSWRKVVSNIPKRQNSEIKPNRLAGKVTVGHAVAQFCVRKCKFLTTSSLKPVSGSAEPCPSVFLLKVLVLRGLTPCLRPTWAVHDRDRYRFTSGNTLSFQVTQGRKPPALTLNQGPVR
ncbi:MAG TPA: hypothetical protein P5114_08290 [Hyphomicrobiaceae bacterium]|nr:hypothetical protein [Hyphomicrobiaceae bacterium]